MQNFMQHANKKVDTLLQHDETKISVIRFNLFVGMWWSQFVFINAHLMKPF